MRQAISNQNLSNLDFSNQKIEGYYSNCNFSNCNFANSTIEAVAVNCKFDGSDFSLAKIGRFHTPGSTFTNCNFRKPVWHTAAHEVMGTFSVLHNHEAIAEICRQWVVANLKGAWKTRGLNYANLIKARKDLSWSEFSKILDNAAIGHVYHIFKDYPPLYAKLKRFRPELEPDELK